MRIILKNVRFKQIKSIIVKEEKKHEFYLKRELRRLKEEDFKKMKERQK